MCHLLCYFYFLCVIYTMSFLMFMCHIQCHLLYACILTDLFTNVAGDNFEIFTIKEIIFTFI